MAAGGVGVEGGGQNKSRDKQSPGKQWSHLLLWRLASATAIKEKEKTTASGDVSMLASSDQGPYSD